MRSINAIFLAPDVNVWLVDSPHPRILHVFEHACNLINERREVLSIVTPQIGNGPFNLVIEDDVLFSDHLDLESPISVFPNQLNLGDLTLHTENAKLWSPRPDWELLRARRDDIAGELKSCLSSWKSNKFDSFYQREALPRIEQAALAQAEKILPIILTNRQSPITNLQYPVSHLQFSNSLISALASANLPSSLTAAQKLAGLGMGLTPAGDDFILGAVLAAWIIHPPEIARVFAKEVTDVAAPLTTSLSAAWLRSAGRGEAGILWHNFFDDLIFVNQTALQESMDKILSVGETSGADALSGFIGTLMYYAVEARTLDG
jgi:hypothetical protein